MEPPVMEPKRARQTMCTPITRDYRAKSNWCVLHSQMAEEFRISRDYGTKSEWCVAHSQMV